MICGRSIGTGPAIKLTSLFRFAGVILVTPFMSIGELFKDRVGLLSKLVEEWCRGETRRFRGDVGEDETRLLWGDFALFVWEKL